MVHQHHQCQFVLQSVNLAMPDGHMSAPAAGTAASHLR